MNQTRNGRSYTSLIKDCSACAVRKKGRHESKVIGDLEVKTGISKKFAF